jgi:hypothetical protein
MAAGARAAVAAARAITAIPGLGPAARTPGQAYAALILGIVGLLFCPFIASILALVFGYQAKGRSTRRAVSSAAAASRSRGSSSGGCRSALWACSSRSPCSAGSLRPNRRSRPAA